jgi:hypothetical protein
MTNRKLDRALSRTLVLVAGSFVALLTCATREHVLASVSSTDEEDASTGTGGSAGAGSNPPVELVVNGDFSDGDTGFDTDYRPFSSFQMAEGEYVVTDHTSGRHSLVRDDVPDHSGDGFMLMINSALEPNVAVWQQRVPLVAGASYRMTVWARHWLPETVVPFDYEVRVDGASVGAMRQEAALEDSGWTRLRLEWVSAASGEVLVALFNMDLTRQNNDHFLDDISLVPLRS